MIKIENNVEYWIPRHWLAYDREGICDYQLILSKEELHTFRTKYGADNTYEDETSRPEENNKSVVVR